MTTVNSAIGQMSGAISLQLLFFTRRPRMIRLFLINQRTRDTSGLQQRRVARDVRLCLA